MKKYKEEAKNIDKENSEKSFRQIFVDVIYSIILIPLLIIALMVVWQVLTKPDEIPNVFGYKFFMILQENMEDSLKYGDLTITKNINPDKLKEGDIVAFRNESNTVTIHKIKNISKTKDNQKQFTMKIPKGNVGEEKVATENDIEGILVKRIPKIGLWIMIYQQPLVTLTVIIVILIVGLIAYYIAGKLDERDRKNQELENMENEEL